MEREIDSTSSKRQKLEKPESGPSSKPKHVIIKCSYIKPKNNKRCGLQVRKGQLYCFAHINEANGTKNNPAGVSSIEAKVTRTNKKGEIVKRVRCTIDPSHTVWEDNLVKHLKICNILKLKQAVEEKEKTCPWFSIDYNVKDCTEAEQQAELAIDYEFWKELIPKWIAGHDGMFQEELPLRDIEFKEGLEERFAELTNHKHIRQQSSLIGQLLDNGLVCKEDEDVGVVVEFGCGRAEFTRYFNKAMGEIFKNGGDKEYVGNYLLVDRDNPRLKFDNKIVTDNEKSCSESVSVERLKVDIKDLKLHEALKRCVNRGSKVNEVGGDGSVQKYIGISKHLCGVATDLTLRCLINAERDSAAESSAFRFGGCLVAMCCRHCCQYPWLLEESKRFLGDHFGIDESNFVYFRKMFSWATNGTMPGVSKSEIGEHFTGLTFAEREEIGLKMRRILDESRKFAMRSRGFDVDIVRYVERDVSLENNCIIIKK